MTDAEIKFIGEEGNQLDSAIRELGSVVVATGISAEQSTIETPQTGNKSPINQAYSFKVILVDKKGNKASKEVVNKAVKGLAVEVAGPSKLKVHWFTSFFVVKLVPLSLKYYYFVHYFSLCRPPLKRQVKRVQCLHRSLPPKLVSTMCL